MNKTRRLAGLALAASLLINLQPSYASGVGGLARGLKTAPGVQYIAGSKPTLAPFAHVVFCMRLPTECENSNGPAVAKMDAERMTMLRSTNSAVNRSIRPKSDARDRQTGFGDDWELAPVSGDCEDYAITKRHRLISAGWPAGSLRLAVVRTTWGEAHAVLVVKTSEGDLVLDSLTNSIKPFQKSGLRFLKIQSDDNPRLWLEL